MKLKKIYEDENVLVIDKPAGIMVHPDEKTDEETIADVFLINYPHAEKVGDKGRHGIVHRLDRNTTGVLILAKNNKTYRLLKSQFKEHKARKTYRAIVEGNIKETKGMISLSLARARSDFRKRTVVDQFTTDVRGEEKEAITRYKVLAHAKDKEGNNFTYVECYPLTGRTHQLRAHFRGIRHPIVGDDLYGSKKGKNLAERSMLHSYNLKIEIPEKGSVEFTAPLPKDFQTTLAKLGF